MVDLFRTRADALRDIHSTQGQNELEVAQFLGGGLGAVGRAAALGAARQRGLGSALGRAVGGVLGAEDPRLKKAGDSQTVLKMVQEDGVSLEQDPEAYYASVSRHMSKFPSLANENMEVGKKLQEIRAKKAKDQIDRAKLGIDRANVLLRAEEVQHKKRGSFKDRIFEALFNSAETPEEKRRLAEKYAGVEKEVKAAKVSPYDRTLNGLVTRGLLDRSEADELLVKRVKRLAEGKATVQGVVTDNEGNSYKVWDNGDLTIIPNPNANKQLSDSERLKWTLRLNAINSGITMIDALLNYEGSLGLAGALQRKGAAFVRGTADLLSLIPALKPAVDSLRQFAAEAVSTEGVIGDDPKERVKEQVAAEAVLNMKDKITPDQLPVIREFLTFTIARTLSDDGRLLASSIDAAKNMVEVSYPDDKATRDKLERSKKLLTLKHQGIFRALGGKEKRTTKKVTLPPALATSGIIFDGVGKDSSGNTIYKEKGTDNWYNSSAQKVN